MLSALIIANGNLSSNGFLMWRFLGLLVHQNQKTQQKWFGFFCTLKLPSGHVK